MSVIIFFLGTIGIMFLIKYLVAFLLIVCGDKTTREELINDFSCGFATRLKVGKDEWLERWEYSDRIREANRDFETKKDFEFDNREINGKG